MSGIQIQNIVSLTSHDGGNDVQVKSEPVDPEYDAALDGGEKESSNQSDASSKSDSVYPSADSSQRIRGILNNLINDNSKELSVKGVIEDLLQRNEYLLAQNDAGLYKPQPRNMSLKRYEEMLKNRGQSSANGNSTPKSDLPGEGAILRPSSPTQNCSLPQKDTSDQTLMEMQVFDSEVDDAFSFMKHEMVCGVASKAYVMTKEGVNIQTDLQFYWCNFCPYKTEAKDVLIQHVMEHRFHCKYCTYQSFSRADVIRHASKEHDEFEDIAKTLKYCTFMPDYLNFEKSKKRKNESEDETEDISVVKRPKMRDNEEDVTRESRKKKDKEKSRKSNNLRSAQEDEYDAFDMEVDEVDEDGDMYDNEEIEQSERVIVPRQKLKTGPKALFKENPKTVTTTMVTVTPSSAAPSNSSNSSSKPSSTVTVSSGLCWNCGYCDFVTLSQTFLKTHLNTQHAGKAHKYVAMLVSSQEEMNKIKERDAQMYQNPNPALLYGNISKSAAFANVPTVTAQKNMNQSPVSSAIETSASYDDSGEDEEFLPEAEKKKYPLTYKCAHCNFNAPVSFKIKEHLQIKHIGCVLYALDMRAVKLKQRRYVFFCHRKNCSFTSKKTEEYLNHSESCTPWLMENCPEPVDANTKKCLELTRSFSQKISQKAFQMAKNFKTNKSAEYACVHCSYTSNNNTRVKKHILSNHKDSDTTMRDLQAHKMNKKQNVYFCKFCLWETREGGELANHLKERHNEPDAGSVSAPLPSMDGAQTLGPSTTAESFMPVHPVQNADLLRVKYEPSRNVASPSSMDSASPSPSPSEEYNEKDEEDYMDDLEVPEEDVRNLMDLYIADEASRGGSSPGRPTREAAARASIRVRAQGQQPPLYRCIHCHSLNFGVNLTRKHIRIHHPNDAFRALDIKKKNSRQACYFCFCPKDGCHYASINEQAVINHAIQDHKYRKEEEELQRLQVLFNAPPVISPHSTPSGKYSSAFECLYCSESFVRASMEKMRQHIHTYHPGEEVIFRDCVARKLRKTSRVFMCGHPPCMFSTADQKEYTLHKLAHDQSQIYECARCQWFTANADQVGNHMSAVHAGEQVTTMEIFLDLDDKGSVVKKVGGTVIKQEPE